MAGPSEMQNCRTQPTVRFAPVSEVAAVEPTSNRSPTRARTTRYETFSGAQMTDDMCAEAAKLFSEHYGMWGQRSSKPEEPVTLGASRLRQQYMPAGADCSYVRVVVDGVLAGHAFVCRWEQGGSTVCWITQLVVRREYRERGLASGLLASLRASPDDVYGIVSSHPAACLATATVLGATIEKVSLDFIRDNADSIMRASPIRYVREATLRGTLFDRQDHSGLVSGVDTGFFVDHEEPRQALERVRKCWHWPLGDLPEGHEYLLVLPGQPRRSRSQAAGKGICCFAA